MNPKNTPEKYTLKEIPIVSPFTLATFKELAGKTIKEIVTYEGERLTETRVNEHLGSNSYYLSSQKKLTPKFLKNIKSITITQVPPKLFTSFIGKKICTLLLSDTEECLQEVVVTRRGLKIKANHIAITEKTGQHTSETFSFPSEKVNYLRVETKLDIDKLPTKYYSQTEVQELNKKNMKFIFIGNYIFKDVYIIINDDNMIEVHNSNYSGPPKIIAPRKLLHYLEVKEETVVPNNVQDE